MKTRLLILLFALVLAGSTGAGGWWFVHRRVDPAQHAAAREAAGDLRETMLLRRQDVADHPNDPGARLRLAQAQLRVYDGAAAEKSFRDAERLGAGRLAVLLGVGEAETVQGAWLRVLDDVPQAAPDPAVAGRMLLLRATAQIALGRLADAADTQAIAKLAAPERVEPSLIAARLASARNDIAAAEAATDAVLRLDPADVDALFLKQGLAVARNDLPGAIAVAGRTIAAAPWSLAARVNRANLLLRSDDDTGARADVDSVLARNPQIPGARFLDAVLVARSGRDADAALAFEQLGGIADLFPRAYYMHAVIAAKLNRTASAMELAATYNQRFPTDRDGARLLAQMQFEAQRPDLAVSVLEKATAAPSADAVLLSMLGAAYAATNNPAAALRVRQLAATAAPADAGVQTMLGLSQLRLGDVSAALETLDRSAAQEAPTAAASDVLFGAALGAGDLGRAQSALARRHAQDGETEMVSSMSALLLLARGDLDGAQTAFEALVKAFPDSMAPKAGLAKLLATRGRGDEAEALLQGVLARDPANVVALTAQMHIWVADKRYGPALQTIRAAQSASPADLRITGMHAELLVRSGAPKEAVDLLERRRQSKTLDPSLLPLLGQAQAAAGAHDAALATYAEVLQAAPGNTAVRLLQADLLAQANRPGPAQASLREALARSPGLPPVMSALVALESRFKGTAAAVALAGALRAEPANMPGAASLKGDVLMAAQLPGQAAQAYRGEFEAAPSRLLVLRLATAEATDGRLDAGGGVLRRWLETHADDPDAEALLARIALQAGHWDEAQALLESRLRHRPADAEALNNLAWIYNSKGDARALALATQAYRLAPSSNTADTLGWIMLSGGNVAQAIDTLRIALTQAPDSPAPAYHLAVALEKDGRPAESVRLLEPLVARPGAFGDRMAAEKLLRELKGRP